MMLDKDKTIVELGELGNQVNTFDEISSSSSNDIREHDIENTNEKNDDEINKVTVNDDVININEGDEENNEEHERSVVEKEEKLQHRRQEMTLLEVKLSKESESIGSKEGKIEEQFK